MLVAAGGSPTLDLGVNVLPEGLEGVFRQKKKKAEPFPLDAVLAEGPRAGGQCRVHLAGGPTGLVLPLLPRGTQVLSPHCVCMCMLVA